jgi:hypothetical protein
MVRVGQDNAVMNAGVPDNTYCAGGKTGTVFRRPGGQ